MVFEEMSFKQKLDLIEEQTMQISEREFVLDGDSELISKYIPWLIDTCRKNEDFIKDLERVLKT